MSNITIYDVAREANVSMATVSRVVNGNPNVKPTTRKKSWKPLNVSVTVQTRWQEGWQVKNNNCRCHHSRYLKHFLFRACTRN